MSYLKIAIIIFLLINVISSRKIKLCKGHIDCRNDQVCWLFGNSPIIKYCHDKAEFNEICFTDWKENTCYKPFKCILNIRRCGDNMDYNSYLNTCDYGKFSYYFLY